ncbi:hypothetical protein CJ195_21315 [Bacillus sp. UMB0899]|nr:hypothetical protein CJ195_21315 [Bacillus sp. UMB0899]
MVDRIFAIFILLVGGVFFIESNKFSEKSGVQTFAPSFFPRVIIILMMILAITLLIKSFFSKQEKNSLFSNLKLYIFEHYRVIAILGLFFVFTMLIPFIGFLFSSMIFMFFATVILRPLKLRFMATNIILSLTLPFIVQWVFQNILNIYLP